MDFGDKTIFCRDCGNPFLFTAGEQEYYRQKGLLHEPGRCPDCRIRRRQQIMLSNQNVSAPQAERENALSSSNPVSTNFKADKPQWKVVRSLPLRLLVLAKVGEQPSTSTLSSEAPYFVFVSLKKQSTTASKAGEPSEMVAPVSKPLSASHDVTPIICSNCGRQTTVPFKPHPDRPVYCAACFAALKNRALT